MYLIIDSKTNDVTIAKSFFELKEYVLHVLFKNKTDVVVDDRLQEIYEDVVSDMYIAEDDEAVRRCMNAITVYFNLRMRVM